MSNDYFINIGPNLAQNIHNAGAMTHKDFLANSNFSSYNFEFHSITENDVIGIINGLASKSSCGYDNISLKLLKDAKAVLSKPISVIINQMFSTGIFPDKLKLAKVLPFYKKGEKALLKNYRPISILPSISKIFEKVIFNQVYQYFSHNNLFYPSQYGFRSVHSTEQAVLEIVDRVIQDMDKGNSPINVYLDLSKAFDTLNHEILLD